MGCGSSTSAQSPGAGGGEDADFAAEANYQRRVYNKKTGQAEVGEGREMPESDMFEVMEAGQGEQFMAVRPYEGAIMEPDNHPPVNAEEPTEDYCLEHVYGYRCADSR